MENTDELVYRLYQGEELLLERRADGETLEKIRATIEPLRIGFHATLGHGKPGDPVVAVGKAAESQDPAVQAAAIAIHNAQEISKLSLTMSRNAVEIFSFTKVVVEEAVAAIRTAGAEERAQFQRQLAAALEASNRPLIDSKGVVEVLGHVGDVIRQVKGPTTDKGPTNG